MKVALYARNSKPPRGWKPSTPDEEPPGSWRIQIARLRASLPANGEVVWEGHDIATGSNPNRPKWAEVMRLVRGGHVQAVHAVKLDRVMRGLKHFLEVADDFQARGAHLVFLDSPGADIRGKDSFSKAVRGIIAVFAELELDLIRERSAEAMERREDGRLYGPRSSRPSGRPAEYGPGHKFRVRAGRREHDRSRCPLCRRGESGAPAPKEAA